MSMTVYMQNVGIGCKGLYLFLPYINVISCTMGLFTDYTVEKMRSLVRHRLYSILKHNIYPFQIKNEIEQRSFSKHSMIQKVKYIANSYKLMRCLCFDIVLR